jgi:hypothetical protein
MDLKDIHKLYRKLNQGYTLTDKKNFIKIEPDTYFIFYGYKGTYKIPNTVTAFKQLMNTTYKRYDIDDIKIIQED